MDRESEERVPYIACGLSGESMEVCRRVKTFEKNGWRTSNRPVFQTPFAFAEAGLECIGSDSVICKRCHYKFEDWEPTDVPLTEHKKIDCCSFVNELGIKLIHSHPHVRYVCDNNVCCLGEAVFVAQKHPNLLDEPLEKFLGAVLKYPFRSMDRHTANVLKAYRIG